MQAGGIGADEKLVTEIVKVNLKFGIYHTMDMLNDGAGLLAKCMDKREKALVSDFLALWEERKPYKKYPKQKQDVESTCEGLDTRCV